MREDKVATRKNGYDQKNGREAGKNYPLRLLLVVTSLTLLGIVGPVGQALAAIECSDVDGFTVPCENNIKTDLNVAVGCSDIDGLPVTCDDQQPTRLDLAEGCDDIDGLPVACREQQKIDNTDRPAPSIAAHSSHQPGRI
jgi:hypothetical protein